MGKFAEYKNLKIEKQPIEPVSEEELNSTLQAVVAKSVSLEAKEGKSELIIIQTYDEYIDQVREKIEM